MTSLIKALLMAHFKVSPSNNYYEIFLSFSKNFGFKNFFLIPLVNRPENRFLGGKNFLIPYFLTFLGALSTRYLAIFSGSGGGLTKIFLRGLGLTIFRRKLSKKTPGYCQVFTIVWKEKDFQNGKFPRWECYGEKNVKIAGAILYLQELSVRDDESGIWKATPRYELSLSDCLLSFGETMSSGGVGFLIQGNTGGAIEPCWKSKSRTSTLTNIPIKNHVTQPPPPPRNLKIRGRIPRNLTPYFKTIIF